GAWAERGAVARNREGQAWGFPASGGAYAKAPEVPRRRLYTETIENVLSHAHKVIIDSRAGSNLVYLPIEKLLEKSLNREAESAAESAAGQAKDQTDQVTIEGSRPRGERWPELTAFPF